MAVVSESDRLFELLCEVLGYADGSGLAVHGQDCDAIRGRVLREAALKLGVDAAYFVRLPQSGDIPVIYFKRMESASADQIRHLHQRIWNQSRVPLLFLITPREIRIYNCFAEPAGPDDVIDNEKRLIEHLTNVSDAEGIRRGLASFERSELESGAFWRRYRNTFSRDSRADRSLLRNLSTIRNKLHQRGLDYQDIHSLLGRSLFTLYLQDRGVPMDSCIQAVSSTCKQFVEVLPDKQRTYSFFAALATHFNGDMFPVTQREESSITGDDLVLLRDFLQGVDLDTGQGTFWRYQFDVIPIELISAIYEEFFHCESEASSDGTAAEARRSGTFYTPPVLAEFLLEEVLPWEASGPGLRVLDPACGSGVFLVGAYRRLIERRRRANPCSCISDTVLREILEQSIHGVDINEDAVRVAAFSLYLTMLDYIEPKDIWLAVKFPKLIGTNLFVRDVFDTEAPFAKREYDVVVGNPPWGSIPKDEDSPALRYCDRMGYTVGDRQIAQAFLWRVGDLLAEHGRACLVVTAKGMLFNESKPNRDFRRQFLETMAVSTILNFSAWRDILFTKATGPAAAVFYRKRSELPIPYETVMYISPKPSKEVQKLPAIILDSADIKYIPLAEASCNDRVWKTAMWGGLRDSRLITRLSELPSLGDVCIAKGRKPEEGFIEGNKAHHHPWLGRLDYVAPRQLRGRLDSDSLRSLGKEYFERPRSPDVYAAPYVLVPQSPSGGRLHAQLLTADVAFSQSILSFPSTRQNSVWLRFVEGFLNSMLATYIVFHSTSRWGVERDELTKADITSLPMVGDEQVYATMSRLGDQAPADDDIFSAYCLSEHERCLVRDTVTLTIDFFHGRHSSKAAGLCTDEDMKGYCRAFLDVVNPLLQNRCAAFKATAYAGGAMPLRVITLQMAERRVLARPASDDELMIETCPGLAEVLGRLDVSLTEEHAPGVYARRHLRLYDETGVTIVKPNVLRYWTASQALADADEIIAEILAGGEA